MLITRHSSWCVHVFHVYALCMCVPVRTCVLVHLKVCEDICPCAWSCLYVCVYICLGVGMAESASVPQPSLSLIKILGLHKSLKLLVKCSCADAHWHRPEGCPRCPYRVCISINITLVGLCRVCLSPKRLWSRALKHFCLAHVHHI